MATYVIMNYIAYIKMTFVSLGDFGSAFNIEDNFVSVADTKSIQTHGNCVVQEDLSTSNAIIDSNLILDHNLTASNFLFKTCTMEHIITASNLVIEADCLLQSTITSSNAVFSNIETDGAFTSSNTLFTNCTTKHMIIASNASFDSNFTVAHQLITSNANLNSLTVFDTLTASNAMFSNCTLDHDINVSNITFVNCTLDHSMRASNAVFSNCSIDHTITASNVSLTSNLVTNRLMMASNIDIQYGHLYMKKPNANHTNGVRLETDPNGPTIIHGPNETVTSIEYGFNSIECRSIQSTQNNTGFGTSSMTIFRSNIFISNLEGSNMKVIGSEIPSIRTSNDILIKGDRFFGYSNWIIPGNDHTNNFLFRTGLQDNSAYRDIVWLDVNTAYMNFMNFSEPLSFSDFITTGAKKRGIRLGASNTGATFINGPNEAGTVWGGDHKNQISFTINSNVEDDDADMPSRMSIDNDGLLFGNTELRLNRFSCQHISSSTRMSAWAYGHIYAPYKIATAGQYDPTTGHSTGGPVGHAFVTGESFTYDSNIDEVVAHCSDVQPGTTNTGIRVQDGGFNLTSSNAEHCTNFYCRFAFGFDFPGWNFAMLTSNIPTSSPVNTAGDTYYQKARNVVRIFKTGDVTIAGNFSSSSDDRIKSDENYIVGATNILNKVRPQTYNKWPRFVNHSNSQKSPDLSELYLPELDLPELSNSTINEYSFESGVVSQQIWYDVPELRHLVTPSADADLTMLQNTVISSYDDPTVDPDYSSWGRTSSSVNYVGFIPYLIESIKEKDSDLVRLTSELAEYKQILGDLSLRLTTLEG